MIILKTPVTLFVITLLFSATASAAQSPTDFLKSIDTRLKPLLENPKKNEGKIIRQINKMLDFKTIARQSLGKHWNDRSDEERDDFQNTLQSLIEKSVTNRLQQTRTHEVIYDTQSLSGNKATVVTRVRDGKGPRAAEIEIAYKLTKQGNGWIVVDMDTDGISLVSNYRSQFAKLIKKEGWDGMMKKMKDKLAEL